MKINGFSLVEIAVVLVIISVLVTIVALPLATQVEQQRTVETGKQLELAKEALIGYALANGRLPCPATDGIVYGSSSSFGAELPNGGLACVVRLGYLPAVTLGIAPVDSSGFAVDAWGLQVNRILYAVADINISTATTACPASSLLNHPLTTTNALKTVTMGCLATQLLITVCSSTPTGGAPGLASGCAAGATLTTSAPFILLSLGKNAATGAVSGSDESHNVDGRLYANQDLYFVSHNRSATGSTGGEFDDIVTWPSLNTLFARMVQAGKLP